MGRKRSGQRYKLKVKFGVRLSEFEALLYYTKAVDLKNAASLCHSFICQSRTITGTTSELNAGLVL